MKRRMKLIACLMSIFILLAGCTPKEEGQSVPSDNTSGEAADKDTLTIAVVEDMKDMNPAGVTVNTTIKIKAQVYETLIEQTTDGELMPLLAESWEWSDDFLTLTVKLKKGIMTHNGEELKASDCLFSLGVLSEGQNRNVTDKMDLKNSKVIDDYTFEIAMEEPYMPVVANLSFPPCAMFSQKGYEEGGGDWSKMDIGTGPYMWDDWSQGDYVKLVAFDRYHVDGQPKIKNINFKVVSEAANRYIEVETGGSDMAYDISAADIPAAEANPDVTLFREFTNDNAYLSFNLRKAPFDDIRVRQAIAHCLDLEGAWKVCMNGIGRPAIGLVPDNVKDSVAGKIKYPIYDYDLDKARELLAEAGYPDGFNCRYHVGDTEYRINYGEYFSNALRQVGINTQIVSLDGATNDQVLKVEKDFDIYTWGIAATNGDIDFTNRYFWSADMESAQRNIMGYNDPEMDKLIEEAVQEGDPEKRTELNKEIQVKALEEVAVIPIYQQEDVFAHVNSLKGLRDGLLRSPLLKYCYFEQ